MVKMIKYTFVLMMMILLSFINVDAQKINKNHEKTKVDLIYKFPAKYLKLTKTGGVTRIGILGGSKYLLKGLKRHQRRDSKFKAFFINSPNDISDNDIKMDMLYVGKEFIDEILYILQEANIRNFIVITDHWDSKKNLMLNFITVKNKILFQINPSNIKKIGITVSENLKKSGAIIIDDKALLEESEQKVFEAQEKIRKKEHEMKMAEIKLNAQIEKISFQEKRISKQTDEIERGRKEIIFQKAALEDQKREARQLAYQAKIQQEELLIKTRTLKEKEYAITEQTLRLKEQQEKADKQETILENQKKEIKERQEKISWQKNEMASQGVIIKTQQNALLVFGGLFAIIIFLGFFLFRSYRIQKRQNVLLAKQKSEIEEQASQLENANKELAKLSVVASETSNAVAILDKNGNFEWVNSGFTRMYGYTLQLLQNELGGNIFKASNNLQIKHLITKSIVDKTSVTYENKVNTRDGDSRWAQTTISPTLNGDGKSDKLVMIDTDITEIKRAEAEIAKRNREIQSSILYAKRIQQAVLTPEEILETYLEEHFILFKPRDIVSGDFYWAAEKNNKLILTAADCTGHGVPGGFMSMLGIAFLNQIIAEKRDGQISSNEILDDLREKVKTSLRQTGKEGEAKDGMDIALCIIDKENMTIDFAGAQNPLIQIRDNEVKVYKGDVMPIGISYNENPFAGNILEMKKGDIYYMFSDGYADQFNGVTRKKFFTKRFRQYLHKIHTQPLVEQKDSLNKTFEEWKGDFRQMDDVLVIGIKI